GNVIKPAGAERAVGIITAGYRKDWTDPRWHDDPGMLEWLAFMQAYLPGADLSDSNYTQAYAYGVTAMQVLRQCEEDFSRENVMRQAANLKNLAVPVLLPDIVVNTSPTNYHPIRQMQLERWTGEAWQLFGEVISSADT
ncbi:MAG: branched-chain amino acid ABC transporter substrate-binding protein, partial [Pseudomonadota bacterium]|nr:branched-chain amino acid ABC transporter substrate-binding protein [Pseudomonadota bacterium]